MIYLLASIEFRFLFVVVLFLLFLWATFDLIDKALEAYNSRPDENESFLDTDGHHIYYDRSVIQKEKFFRANPHRPQNSIRSIPHIIRSLLL